MEPIDNALWEAFQREPGEKAFEPLYERTKALVYTICLRVLRQPEDATDAFQATYGRLLAMALNPAEAEEFESFDPMIRRLAVREANNLSMRRRRRQRRETAMETPPVIHDPAPSALEQAALRQRHERLEALVALLPGRFRVVVGMHYFDGFTHREIAEMLEMPVSTVGARLARGVKKLQSLARRAGMGNLGALAGAGILGEGLINPPASHGAVCIFARALEAVKAGQIAAAFPSSGLIQTFLKGLVAMKAVPVAVTAVAAVALATSVYFGAPAVSRLAGLSGWGASWGHSAEAVQSEGQNGDTNAATLAAALANAATSSTLEAGAKARAQAKGGQGASGVANGADEATSGTADGKPKVPGGEVFGVLHFYEDGKVKGPAGGLEARLTTNVEGGEHQVLKVQTGADGSFRFKDVPPGHHSMQADQGKWRYEMADFGSTDVFVKSNQTTGPRDMVLIARGTIAGVITDKETGQPVAGAKVQGGNSVETDARGAYEVVTRATKGQEEITISAPGYVGEETVVAIADGRAVTANVALEHGAEVAVQVVDEKNNPIEGARIALVYGGYWKSTDKTSDPKGQVTVDGISRTGRNRLGAEKEGYSSGQITPTFAPGQPRGTVRLVMRKTDENKDAYFTGRVTGPDGTPIPNIAIGFGRPDESNSPTVPTDQDGKYTLHATNYRGSWSVLFTYGKGWAPQAKQGLPQGTEANPTVVDFKLEAGHWLAGVVVDEEEKPVAQARIYPRFQTNDYLPVGKYSDPSYQTDAEGKFHLVDLPGPAIQLQVSGDGYTDEEIQNQPVDRDVRFVLKPSAMIVGQAVDKETGQPITSFKVRITGNRVISSYSDPGISFNSTDGRFKVERLDFGLKYTVTVEAEGYAPGYETDIPAQPADAAVELTIALEKGGSLKGRLVDAASQAPVAGATIYHLIPNGDRVTDFQWDRLDEDNWSFLSKQRTQSAADGSFSFTEGENKGVLAIRMTGYKRLLLKPEQRPAADAEGIVVIGMKAGASVTGQYFENGAPKSGVSMNLYLTQQSGSGYQNFEQVTTDGEGRFSWDGLEPADYSLTPMQRHANIGFGKYSKRFTLAEGEAKTVNLGNDLGPCSLSGKVTMDGQPLDMVNIALKPGFEWDYSGFRDYSDAAVGGYAIKGLREGTYQVSLDKWNSSTGQRDYDQMNQTIEIHGDTKKDFELHSPRKVKGRLVFDESISQDDRAKYQGAYLQIADLARIQNPDNPQQISYGAQSKIAGDQLEFAGRFSGSYRVSLQYQNGNTGSAVALPDTFNLNNLEADQDLGDIHVPATGMVHVRLSFTNPAAPKPKMLTLMIRDGEKPQPSSQMSLKPEEGDQLVGPVPTGSHQVALMAMGYKVDSPLQSVTIAAGQEPELAFTLTADGWIVGNVSMDQKSDRKQLAQLTLRVRVEGNGITRTATPISMKDAGSYLQRMTQPDVDLTYGPSFMFRNLPEGSYQVTVEADGYQAATQTVNVTLGQFAQTKIPLKPAQ